MSSMATENRTESYVERVGTQEDGAYMVVRVELTDHEGGQTVEHGEAGPFVRVGIQGELYKAHTSPLNGHDPIGAGQNRDDLATITKPAPGWTLDEIAELGAIWDRWHLNDLRAGCAHMDLPADKSYDARKDITCPETGYKYGSAWLVEEVPADVLDRLRHLMRDRSHDLYAARGYDAAGKKYPQS